MKKIAIEEHFLTPEMSRYTRAAGLVDDPDHVAYGFERSLDWDARVQDMDAHGIDMQILCLRQPGIQAEPDTETAVTLAIQTNDTLAKRISADPERFGGFAVLPLQDPEASADELERAVNELGLVGALINGHSNGQYLDSQKYWVVYERAEHLRVPIYLHPVRPQQADDMRIYRGHPELLGATWGYTVETATHALRLLFGGVFDAFPKLQLILGHMGETLPYVAWRMDRSYRRSKWGTQLRHCPSYYLQNNILITTSGAFSEAALICALLTMGADRILFAVDYPFELNEEGVSFIMRAPISDRDRAKICHRNAERILRL